MENSKFFSRKNPRWKGYDYSRSGAYFITFCTHNRKCVLSKIDYIKINDIEFDAKLVLTETGKAVKEYLEYLEKAFPGLRLGEYVIMPNHVHFMFYWDNVDPSVGVSRIVGSIKTFVSKRCGTYSDEKLFQRSFYDRVIRNRDEYAEIAKYIINNPKQWAFDKYNPHNRNNA
ncbi:MAG: transposase [Clostridia bacterium]|nr:transposase [Clostridia bacterium]